MKIINFLLIALTLLCFASCGSKETEVNGEVFIVTEGAGSYKFGLVEVSVIPEKDISAYLETKNTEIKPFKDEYERLKLQSIQDSGALKTAESKRTVGLGNQAEIDAAKQKATKTKNEFLAAKNKLNDVGSGEIYYKGLPKSAITALTNSDGKFTLKIPKPGRYALSAYATRKVADKTEGYLWLVLIEANGEPKTILLSNNNNSSSGSSDSMVKTVENEQSIEN